MKTRLILAVLLLTACGRGSKAPDGLLEREKFEQVLAGALLIEARLNHEMVVDKRIDSPMPGYYAELFKEQGVSEQAFKATYDYYVQHPDELKKIYEAALNDLQQRADSTAAH